MDPLRLRSPRSLALALPAAAFALLLSACVPLDAPAPDPTSSTATPAPIATAQAATWENCPQVTIGAGEAKDNGVRFVAVRQERRSPGATETRDFISERFTASIAWDAHGPESTGIDEMISEAIGHPVSGSIGGFTKVRNALSANTETGRFVGYEAINQLSVPVTVACGETLTARGTVDTWQSTEAGILDCELGHAPEAMGRIAREAKKLYCND